MSLAFRWNVFERAFPFERASSSTMCGCAVRASHLRSHFYIQAKRSKKLSMARKKKSKSRSVNLTARARPKKQSVVSVWSTTIGSTICGQQQQQQQQKSLSLDLAARTVWSTTSVSVFVQQRNTDFLSFRRHHQSMAPPTRDGEPCTLSRYTHVHPLCP